MNNLIKVTEKEGKQIVGARDVYEVLGFNPTHWKKWYTKNIEKNPFAIQGVDWEVIALSAKTSGGRPTLDFALTLDFAKRLSMLARTEKGEEVRQYFISCEKKALHIPVEYSRKELLLMALKSEEEKEQALLQVENLSTALDNLLEWVSIIKVATFNNISEVVFKWHVLKKKSFEMGYAVKKAQSNRYDYQNLYNINVFKACYPQFNYNFLIESK